MAITINGAAVIAMAVKKGVKLGNLVTVGRQGMYAPKAEVNELLRQVGRPPGYVLPVGDPGYPVPGEWADDLYRHFGAEHLGILDGSAYEGADLVHDLNRPLPRELTNRFDCLIDGGSLEHVFNVPEALASYMKMIKVGGHVILLDMPVTNLSGHGFYQFSPALFWQVFSREHGFRVVEMVVAETRPFAEFWRVRDPAEYGGRVELVHNQPCHLYVIAEKLGEFSGFEGKSPIQHDYTQAWDREVPAISAGSSRATLAGLVRRILARMAPKLYWKISNARNARRRLNAVMLGAPEAPYTRISGPEAGGNAL